MTDSIELVRRAQGGDEEALELLFARYHGRVRRIVRLRLPDRLRRTYDSVDIVQEAFVAAIGAFDRFEMRDESSLVNWLARIAENCIRNRGRKRSSWEERALESVRRLPEAPDAGPAELAAREEERRVVDDCIRALPEPYREVVIQRHLLNSGGDAPDASTWERVAESIGSPSPDAARMLYARARVELAALLRARLGGR